MPCFLLMFMWLALPVWAAAPQNQVPSCYAANKLGIAIPPSERELFVLLDQTTVLDDDLKQSLAAVVRNYLKPGTAFTVIRFSAFSQGRYMDVVASGVLEKNISADGRDSIGVPVLKTFDACLLGQAGYGLKLAFGAIDRTLKASTSDLIKSDVISSLTEVSRVVKASAAPMRAVLVVSDMLENSTITSFYANNRVRRIDPATEIKAVDSNHLFGDFGGASIYVMGAGLIPEPLRTSKQDIFYRDPKTLGALKQFWTDYFVRSKAKLTEFGQPALLQPLK